MTKNSSAIKRSQISLRNNMRNKDYKSAIKTLIKKALYAIHHIENSNYVQADLLVSKAYSKIDKAVKKGIIKKNNAARKKSMLLNKLKSIKID